MCWPVLYIVYKYSVNRFWLHVGKKLLKNYIGQITRIKFAKQLSCGHQTKFNLNLYSSFIGTKLAARLNGPCIR
jgi:hypothetical protein